MSDISSILGSQFTGSANSTEGTGKSELGKDDFLKLMITQLKYQDPLNPMESNEYASQLAQFSSLEQLSNLNENVTNSIDANYYLTQSINNTMSATLIGKDVKLTTNAITYNGQDSVDLGYTLPADASELTIKIYDEYGNLVNTVTPDKKTEGDSKLSWDFTDNNGSKVGIGNYTFEVAATSTNGTDMTVDNYLVGTIGGIKFTEEGTMLMIGNVAYSVAQITEIFNPDEG